MENLEILIQNIEQWAIERNLIEGSTPQKQRRKITEEFGELNGGINIKDLNEIKDGIGDTFVAIVIQNKQLGLTQTWNSEMKELENKAQLNEFDNWDLGCSIDSFITSFGRFTESFYQSGNPIILQMRLSTMVEQLWFIAYFNDLNFTDCIQHTYNQIKDRKGRMIDGVWVKQEDLQND